MPRRLCRLMEQPLTKDEQDVYHASAHLTLEAIAVQHRRSKQWVQNTLRRAEKKLGSGYTDK